MYNKIARFYEDIFFDFLNKNCAMRSNKICDNNDNFVIMLMSK